MLKRVLLILSATLLLALVLWGISWYLAFSAGPNPPSSLALSGLTQHTTASWSVDGPVRVEAEEFKDAITGYGYGMARSRTWQLLLWRQAAIGGLSTWFGLDAVPIDRLTRQLALGLGARTATENLTEHTRETLERLSTGINGALSSEDLPRDIPLLLLSIEPIPWEPWHSIAIERLYSWISTSPFPASDSSSFAMADRSLREILQVYGLNHSMVVGSENEENRFISARFVTGDSAVPIYVESSIQWAEHLFTGLLLPGTLVAPLGATHTTDKLERAWGIIQFGRAAIKDVTLAQSDIEITHDRIQLGHSEHLVSIYRNGNEMPLVEEMAGSGSQDLSILSWSGFRQLTKMDAWVRLVEGKSDYQDAIGLRFEQNQLQMKGSASSTLLAKNGLQFMSNISADHTPYSRVGSLPGTIRIEDLLMDTFSESDARLMPDYLPFLRDSLLSKPRSKQAASYLRNWNHHYASSEIGATIFEGIKRANIRADSTLSTHLEPLLNAMGTENGFDMSAWRWQVTNPRTLSFPGTSAANPDAGRKEESFKQKFALVQVGGEGHEQTFYWGSTSHPGLPVASSAWEGGLDLNSGDLFFRRPSIDYRGFLGSFLSADRPLALQNLSAFSPEFSTQLEPRQ